MLPWGSRSKDVVPAVADRNSARHDRAVATDDGGAPVTESQEVEDAAPHDDDAFEGVLKDQLDDLRP